MATGRPLRQRIWPAASAAIVTALYLLAAMSVQAADELNAAVDRTRLHSGETLQLTLTFNAQVVFGEPDFSSLDKDFEILSTSRQSQLTIVNGQNQSSTAWHLTLLPKRAGELIIPSFNFKGAVSDAIELVVSADAAGGGAVGGDKALYAETLVDKDSAYVQEQLLLTLRLYSSEPAENLTVDPPDIAAALVKEVARSQYQKQINGKSYLVAEIKFAVFAENSGELRIPPARFTGIVADRNDPFGNPFFNRSGRQMEVASEAKTIRIKPRPAQVAAGDWLPTTGLGLSERWSNNATTLVVGEPVTRTVTVTAQGLTGAQLPPLPALDASGLQTYPDQPQLDDRTSDQGVIGNRTESIAIVPTAPGTLVMPPIRVQWWDIGTDQPRETILEGRTFTVAQPATTATTTPPADRLPPANPANSGDQPADANPPPVANVAVTRGSLLSHPVVIVLILGNALCLVAAGVFAALWWRKRTHANPVAHSAEAPSDNAAFKPIRQAAAARDLPGLRQAILAWAAMHWPQAGIRGLREVAATAADDALRTQLTAFFLVLDNCLYGSGDATALDVDGLVKSLEVLRRQPLAKNDRQQDLPPLYPE